MINSDGEASIEDVLSFYASHGAPGKSILVHDNYLQGAFATGQTTTYTGGGVQMDGDSSNDLSITTGFVQVQNNTIVHLAGFGISIAAGHDISVIGNRIVSCNKDSSGNWIEGSQGSVALVMVNYYQTNQYFNNYMADNSGGVVKQNANGDPTPEDIYAPSESEGLHNVVGMNVFEQPCLAASGLNLAAESEEKMRWLNAVFSAGELLGDQH